MAACRSCGADILWVRTTKGKRMPLDPVPDPDRGRVVLDIDTARVLTDPEIDEARRHGDALYVPHWATCKDADLWRAKGKGTA